MADRKRIVIVGGVAGGASAAARARRLSEDVEIVLFERGGHISFANCGMPYYVGGVIPQRERLVLLTGSAMNKRFRIDVHTHTEVVRIDRSTRTVTARHVKTGQELVQPYDTLILSPGAEPVRPPLPGADHPLVFTLRNLHDMDAIKQIVDRQAGGKALLIGGGYIGLEMAEALRERGLEVTLAELNAQVFTAMDPEMVAPIHQQLTLHGVNLRLGTSVTEVRARGEGLTGLLSTGESVDCDLAILAVGVRPEVNLAREAGLEIGPTGGILVDDRMRTSDPVIFAVGDAVEVKDFVGGFKTLIPLAGPANRQGRIAADNALGGDSVYRDTQGTAACKIFDATAALTGLSEKQCRRRGIACEKIYIHPASHAGYYPGAAPMSLKLLFAPDTGKVLGAQAVGAEGVDKRIDVIATAIRAGMTVYDLKDLELCYAPPYSSAKDPVNYAGFVAANVLEGKVRTCHAADVIAPRDNQRLVDVRTPAEVEAGTIPGAINIPIDDLRERLGELPADKELLVFCQVGLRGYLACRILEAHGLACRNLSGGYKTYLAVTGGLPPLAPPAREVHVDTGESDKALGKPALSRPPAEVPIAREIDARGMQCPGPIMRLKAALDELKCGQAVSILASDPGFAADVRAWCHSTHNQFVEVTPEHGAFRAKIVKCLPQAPTTEAQTLEAATTRNKSLVVFSGDFDKAMAAFIIANGAASMGSKVTMFFTFWGLNILRKDVAGPVPKTPIERALGWMMPRGAGRLRLSKLNMAGLGTAMIKGVMKSKKVASLPELIESARKAGVEFVACNMSMELMGIRKEELIDGVQLGGVAMYLDHAEKGNVNLFI